MKNTRLLLLAIVFLGSIAFSGCFSSSSEIGTYAIDLSGGDGFHGGDGDNIWWVDGMPQSFTISTIGAVTIDYTPVMPTGLHGTNHLDITVDTIISIDPVEPVTGTPYLVSGQNSIYIFDGDGSPDGTDPVVNSIKIHSGRTLTLGVNGEGDVNLELTNDFINFGTVTTLDSDPVTRVWLNIDVNSFINHGTIALNGVLPGQNGGVFKAISTNGSFSSGTVNTYGADMVDGNAGRGGSIYIVSRTSVVQNLGPLNCFGGSATGTSGRGGFAGRVDLGDLSSEGPTVFNAGKISAYGGNSVTYPGNGSPVSLASLLGNVFNVGEIIAYGGDSVEFYGGDGGDAVFSNSRSQIKSIGNINVSGGDAMSSDSDGGDGGFIGIYFGIDSVGKPKESATYTGGLVQFAGNIIARGGKSPLTVDALGEGGDGGHIAFNIFTPGVEISLQGYGRLTSNGGNGQEAGCGGNVQMYISEKFENQAAIDLKGGNAIDVDGSGVAYGGPGGDLLITNSYEGGVGEIVNSGHINVSGGTHYNRPYGGFPVGDNSGAGGSCKTYAQNSLKNTGNITCTGGNDVGNDPEVGAGGLGGAVELICYGGPLVHHGAINVSGGNGSFAGGYAGRSIHLDKPKTLDASGVYLQGLGSVDCRGDVIAHGGNADAALAGSIGGDGGRIEIACDAGPGSVQTGTVAGNAGVGETNGEINDIIIGGLLIQAGTIAP